MKKWFDRKLKKLAYAIVKSKFIQKRVTFQVPVGKMFLSREILNLDGLFLKSSGYKWHTREDILATGYVYAGGSEMQCTTDPESLKAPTERI